MIGLVSAAGLLALLTWLLMQPKRPLILGRRFFTLFMILPVGVWERVYYVRLILMSGLPMTQGGGLSSTGLNGRPARAGTTWSGMSMT